MEVYSELVESLKNCDAACKNCAISCVEEEDIEKMSNCIKLNLHCAEVCHLALSLVIRDSEYAESAVELCINICAESATECDEYEHDQCLISAEACRRTAAHCRNYLEQAAKPESI